MAFMFFKIYNIQAIVISHSHFIVDRVFTEAYVPDPDKDFVAEMEKIIPITEYEREQRSQIREIKFEPDLKTHNQIQIYSDRRRIMDQLENEAKFYFMPR